MVGAVERGSAALVTLDGTPDETALRTIFTEFDANGDGMIDRHEIKVRPHLTFGTLYLTLGTLHFVLDTWHLVLDT